jgi:hypothetical protein
MKTVIEVDTNKHDVYLVDKEKGFIWRLVDGFEVGEYVISPTPEPSYGKFGRVSNKKGKE